jgi:RNA polymerase-interacting CarD/CdnL/TRCF family regulator
MAEFTAELQQLKAQVYKLKEEEWRLIVRITEIEKQVARLDKTNKESLDIVNSINQGIPLLTSEVASIRQVVETNQQDLQLIIKLLQYNLSMGSNNSKQQSKENKAAMDSLISRIKQLVADTFKKDNSFEKQFNELLTSINEAWSDRIDLEENIVPDLEAVTAVLTKDIQNLAIKSNGSKSSSNMFNTYINPSVYMPNKTSDLSSLQSSHANGQSSSQPKYTPSQQPPKSNLLYDVDENEVEGLAKYISLIFPQAIKYDAKSVAPTSVVFTFIIVHDRLDLNKWIPICENRTNRADKHFVILVCNQLGDAIRITTDKLPCKALLKAEFIPEFDISGTSSGRPKQKYIKQSLDDTFKQLRQMM